MSQQPCEEGKAGIIFLQRQENSDSGTSLAVQQLRLHTSTEGLQVRSLVGELRFHMLPGVGKKKKKQW